MKTNTLILLALFFISSCTTIRIHKGNTESKSKKVFKFLAKNYKDKTISKDGYKIKGFYFSDEKNTCFTKNELLVIKQKVLTFDKWVNNLGIKKDTLYSLNDCLGLYSIYPLYTYKNNIHYSIPMLYINDNIFINVKTKEDNNYELIQKIHVFLNMDSLRVVNNEIHNIIIEKFSTPVPIYLKGHRWQKVKSL